MNMRIAVISNSTFPCAECGRPVDEKKLAKGATHCFCSASCHRKFQRDRTPEDCDKQLSVFNAITRLSVYEPLQYEARGDRFLSYTSFNHADGNGFCLRTSYRSKRQLSWTAPDGAPAFWQDFFDDVKTRRNLSRRRA